MRCASVPYAVRMAPIRKFRSVFAGGLVHKQLWATKEKCLRRGCMPLSTSTMPVAWASSSTSKGRRSHSHRPAGAAASDQPAASRRLRLRGQHRRRRRHPDPDAGPFPPEPRPLASACTLPPERGYGAGLVFLPREERPRRETQALFERIVTEEGQRAARLARRADRRSAMIGPSAVAVEPVFKQVFIGARSRAASARRVIRRATPRSSASSTSSASASSTRSTR